MPKKMKLNLKQLKVQSFITSLDRKQEKDLKAAGDTYLTVFTVLCCLTDGEVTCNNETHPCTPCPIGPTDITLGCQKNCVGPNETGTIANDG